jgi:prepilin-type N-terminal cleavage/methylation domain-containing protein
MRSPLLSDGFTLLEVLLASTILVVLMVLLLGMGSGALRLWRDGEQRRESLREARAALQIISEDLHSAVITTNQESLLVEKDPKINEGECERLFFLTSHPCDRRNAHEKGDLCAAGYFIARDSNESGARNLYRFHVAAETVAKAVENNCLSKLYAQASPTNENTTELLARNIVGFRIRQLPQDFHPPEALEVTVSAINGTTERLLSSEPMAVDRNQRLLKRHLQNYSVLIHLPPLREFPNGS